MTEQDLFKCLRSYYPQREFALLPQVANGTGENADRHADALAVGLWPSRGMHIHGFEIKTYRGDWIRELRNPAKAESIAQYCNHWWIVTGQKGMVRDGELPPGWGLYEYDAKAEVLVRTVAAPFKEATPVNLSFVAAILRKAQEVIGPEAEIKAAHDEGYEKGKEDEASRGGYIRKDYDALKKTVRDFEKASGIELDTWSHGDEIGKTVSLILNGGIARETKRLKQIASSLVEALAAIEVG